MFATPSLAYAGSAPCVRGVIRHYPEDFQVEEQLPFAPDGDGTHALLYIRKCNTNTAWLAQQLARFAGVKPVAVGYAGLKDKHAVTSQWFSVNMEGVEEPDWTQFDSPDIEVLTITRHRRKLKRGALKGNRFVLVVRELAGDLSALEQRLSIVAADGVPNYFGEQRFGHNNANLEHAMEMFTGNKRIRDRHKRGLYLSAARSLLFNQVLSQRVERGSWNQALAGDVMLLDGSRSFFVAEQVDEDIEQRVKTMDIHPSGPLWGRGETLSTGEVRTLEQEVLQSYEILREGLEQAGMKQERRSLRLKVQGMGWEFPEPAMLKLWFQLPAGTYATSVLRELVSYRFFNST